MPLSRWQTTVVFLERSVLPPVFLALAYYAALQFHRTGVSMSSLIAAIDLLRGYSLDQAVLANLLSGIMWLTIIAFDIVIAMLLAKSAPIARPVTRAREVLIPLASTFLLLFYNFIPWMPEELRRDLFAGQFLASRSILASATQVIGLGICLKAALTLNRSFGIFVQARPAVYSGLYRYVRHPIYGSYCLIELSLVIASGMLGVALLACVQMCLLVARARMEEASLAAAYPEYGEYARRAGFFWPRFYLGRR